MAATKRMLWKEEERAAVDGTRDERLVSSFRLTIDWFCLLRPKFAAFLINLEIISIRLLPLGAILQRRERAPKGLKSDVYNLHTTRKRTRIEKADGVAEHRQTSAI